MKTETTQTAQHTPGPWINRVGPSADLIVESASEALFPPMVATVSGWHESGHQIEALANARLIAAAPDLLAFAGRVASWQGGEEGMSACLWSELIRQAGEVVAKAEGNA